MVVEELYKKKKEENPNALYYNVDRLYWAKNGETIGKEIADRVNTWLANNKNYLSNAQNRFSGDMSKYRSDSSDWLTTVTTQRNNFIKEADSIKSVLEQYKDFFEPDYVNSVIEALDGNLKAQESVISSATQDRDFWTQFDSEDSYNSWYKDYKAKQDIMSAEDFAEYSQKGANIENPSWDDANGLIYFDLWRPFGKDVNNIVTFSRDNIDSIDSKITQGAPSASDGVYDYRYRLMEDDEVAIYNYYLGKGDTAKAEEYLASLDETLNKRWGKQIAERVSGQPALEIIFAAGAGIDQFASGIKNLDNLFMGTEADATTATQYASSAIKQDLNGFMGGVYDLTQTISNQLPSIAIGMMTFGIGGNIALGASAAGNAYSEMKDAGYSAWQAQAYAGLIGVSETLLSKLLGGITGLAGKTGLASKLSTSAIKALSQVDNALARVAIQVGSNMVSEAIEESAQSILEPIFKSILTGKNLDIDWGEVAYSGLLGALSAGVIDGAFTGVGTIASSIDAKNAYGNNVHELVAQSLELNPENAHAQRMQTRLDNGKNVSGYQIDRLLEANNSAILSNDVTAIKNSVEARLTELGEKGDVKAISAALAKQAQGEKLTFKEKELIKSSTYGQRVANELNIDNIKSGEYSSSWAENIGTRAIHPEAYNKDLYELAKMAAGVKEEASVAKAIDESKKVDEAKIEVSDTGKNMYYDAETNSYIDADIKRIVSTKGGIKVELENGKTVSASDIRYATREDGVMYEIVANMDVTPETANEIINTFKPSNYSQANLFFDSIPLAYRMGLMGNEQGLKYINLPDAQKRLIYNRGRIDAVTNAKERDNARATSAKETMDKASYEKKGIIFEDGTVYNEATANDLQKAGMAGAEIIAKTTNLEVHVFESKVEDGKRVTYINGEKVLAPNGYFTEGNKIYIDINAGMNAEGAMLYVLSHEITHYIRKWNAQGFKDLADFLIAEYGKQGVDITGLIERQKDKIKKRYERENKALPNDAKLFDMAYEELVSDAMSDMLADPNAYKKLKKLKKKNFKLWQKLGEVIKQLLDKLKNALNVYRKESPVAVEAFKVRNFTVEAYNKLQDLYIKAFVEADANYAASVGEMHSEVKEALGKGATIEVNENGEFTVGQTKDGTILYNDRTYDEGGREALRETLIAEGFSADDIKAALTIIDAKHELVKRLGKEISEQDKVNKATLTTDLKDGHAVLSALVSNGDYPVNIDLLMVCKKRLAYQRVINRLCETGLIKQATLDSLAIAEINKILGKYGFETACLGCFVESRRIRIQEWAETICKEWNGIVDKMVKNAKPFNFASETFVKDLSNKEVDTLANDLESAYERDGLNYGRQTVIKKMEQLLREVPSLRKHLSVADLITPQGRTHIKALSSELNSLIACRYGSNTPKIVQDFNPYNHELAKYGKVPSKYSSLRDYLYAIGGARMQSFSDFIVENWFDYCQIVADLAARKLPMHTYTKEIALVKLFGMTGIKINMSLIPDIDRSLGKEYAGLTKNANGEYELIWADKDRFKATGGKSYMQSINFADAMALQSDPRYSSNVGTIAVGISKKHIEMMLDDARIRMIIPYHSSGMNPIFAQLVGTDYYTDYTDVQNTRIAYFLDSKGNRRDLKLTKSQKDNLTSGFEFNETLQKLGDARATAQAYLDWCADASKHTITINGETYTAVLTPKFDEFAYHDNYYKLLEDFNTYDSITEKAAPQGDVQQIYPDEFEKILTDELKDRERYRQKQEPKWDTAMDEIEAYLKKHTKADTDAYAQEHGIKLSDRDSLGNELSEAQQEFFKESKVRDKKGNLMVLYHGTTANFNTFKKGDVGFHFGTKGAARGRVGFGKNVTLKEVYLNITNPIVFDEDLGSWDADYRLTRELYDMGILTQEEAESVLLTDNRMYNRTTEAANKKLASVLSEKGYDGIAYSNTFETKKPTTSYIVFNSNQAKEITNKAPTSDPDIRYSDRDLDSVSNRTLLANALESVAQSDIEKNKLTQYKEKTALIDAEQKKLAEIRAKIKELSFAKGARDTKAIKDLQFEANQIANRINTYDKQLLNLEATSALKNVLEREKTNLRKKIEQKGKEALNAQRAKNAETVREIMTRNAESRKRAVESRNKTEVRNKIKKIVSELNTLLLNPTAKKHIKEELRKEVADALSAINMDTVGADERIAKYNALIAKETDPVLIEELTKTRDRIQLQGERLTEKLNNLQAAYEKIKTTEDIELNLAYQEVIHNSIKSVSNEVGETPIRNMTLEQLEMVYDLFKMIKTTIRDANKAFKAKKGETIMQMAEAVNDQVRTVGGQPYKRNIFKAALQRVGWTFLKPLVAFRTIGSVTFTDMYMELRNGEDTFFKDVSEAQAFIEAQYEKHGYKSWDMKKTKTFTAKSGKTFDLNLEQMMSMYAYYQRQKSHKHIMEGGIVFEDAVITTKNKLGIPIKYEVTTKDAFNLSEETFKGICEYLEANHKEVVAFVKEMQEYLSKVMGAKGNEVSMELLGVMLFKEEFYLPIKSSQDYMNFKAEEAGEVKLKSPSFSKETVPYANNPIVLHNFTDLWAEHINNMAMYHSFVLALEDFTKVYNYKTKTDSNVETISTKATLETAYPGVTKYINKFLKDMNGGVRVETVGWADKLMSLAKKGAVLGSASVAIQQTSAVMRAMAYINPKYFVKTTFKSLNLAKHNQDWEELKKYAPIAGIKEMGRFDVGMGQATNDWIQSNKNLMEKAEDVLSIAPAFMDEFTWVSIWNAVKSETAQKNPKVQVGSNEFFEIAGERFTEIISLSQVYDSVFARSDLMRNKSWIAKALTAFMAEPTTTLNMIWDSWVQAKRTGSVKGYAKATIVTGAPIVASIVLNAALKSIVMAMRDDDDDESYIEKYLEHFVGDLRDNANPLNLVPIVKDIVSVFKGYDVERMDMALFSDLKNAIDAFESDNKTEYEKWSGLIGAISAFFGVPFKNVERDVRGLINTVFGETESTTSSGLFEAIKKGWTGEDTSDTQELYEAILNGDQEQIDRIKGRYEDDKAIESAIKKALRDNDSRIKEAAKARSNGDLRGYENYINRIVAEGHFDEDVVVGAIRAEQNAFNSKINEAAEAKSKGNESEYKDIVRELREAYRGVYSQDDIVNLVKMAQDDQVETSDESVDEATSIYSGSDINSAFDSGDYAMAQEIIADLIETKVANGMEEKNAKSSVRSSMTSYWKPLYKEAYQAGDTNEMARIRKILYSSGLYGKTNDVVKTTQGWLRD